MINDYIVLGRIHNVTPVSSHMELASTSYLLTFSRLATSKVSPLTSNLIVMSATFAVSSS